MKNQTKKNGFVQIPILIAIIVGVLIFGSTGYLGVKQYQKYEMGNKIKEERIQKEQEQKDAEVEKLKQEVEALKNKKPDVVKQSIVKEKPKIQTPPDSMFEGLFSDQQNDTTSVIKQWKTRVAFIDCKFVFQGINMGEQYGSGYIFGYEAESGNIFMLTNKHVVDIMTHYSDGEPTGISATATSCDIKIPGDSQFATVYNEAYNDNKGENPFSVSAIKEDFSMVTIKNPTPYMKSIIRNLWDGTCKKKAELGEKILILGYPGIGDQNDVTVTDGIISGYDGNYYITSAKIEKGNSGGVAISLKNNCYLGIPTFVVSGSVESLARILNINVIIPN